MTLSEKIHYCRRRAGLSQEALAERIGVSRQAISKWETGEAAPEISKLPLLARTFNVTADWLLEDGAGVADDVQQETAQAGGASAGDVQAGAEEDSSAASAGAAYPAWMEHLPHWLGRMLKKYGWLFGVRMAISGALFTALGFVARLMSSSMDSIAGNAMGNMPGGVTFYDNAGNIIDPSALGLTSADLSAMGLGGSSSVFFDTGMADPFNILCTFIIVLGLVLLVGGALLAWYLKKWGERTA